VVREPHAELAVQRGLLGGVGVSEHPGKVSEAVDEGVDLGRGEDNVGPGAGELLLCPELLAADLGDPGDDRGRVGSRVEGGPIAVEAGVAVGERPAGDNGGTLATVLPRGYTSVGVSAGACLATATTSATTP
jgi:hypothetical protein